MRLFKHPDFEPAIVRPADRFRRQGMQPAVILPALLVQFLAQKVRAGRIA